MIMSENKKKFLSTSLRTPTIFESYSFETVLGVKELVYTWTIKNLCNTHKKAGESIKSSLLQTKIKNNTWHWSLAFYPRGKQEANQVIPSLVLSQWTTATEQDQKVYLKIHMVNGQGEESLLYEDFFTFSCVTLSDVSLLTPFTKDKLADWIISQDLKIVCKMYLNVNYSNSTIIADPAPKVEDTILTNQRPGEFDDFEKLLDNQKYSDVKLIAGEKQFYAHKNILAARSSRFADLFERDASEKSCFITNVPAEVMKEVLRFVYTGKVNDVESITDELLKAAVHFKLNGLIRICSEIAIRNLNRHFLNDIVSLFDSSDCLGEIFNITLDFELKLVFSAGDEFKKVLKEMSVKYSVFPIYCCFQNPDGQNPKMELHLWKYLYYCD